MKDKRRAKRLEMGAARLNATLAIIQNKTVTGCLVPVKDFSKTGAGVYAKFKVEPNTQVRLSIEGFTHIPLEGRVVWCSGAAGDMQAPETHPFRLGIDFVPTDDASRENQLEVYNYVSQLVD